MLHRGPIAGIASHGNLIATAGYDNQVILWDGRGRKPLARACHDHLVNQCAFSADGRWLVSASSDYTARVWSVPDLRLCAVLNGHADDVDMALFSPDGSLIATCALDRCVRIFDRDGRCLHEMKGHTGNVLALSWAADGRRVVSSGVDGTIRVWDVDSGRGLHTTDMQVRSDTVEIGPDGTLYVGDDRGRIAAIVDGVPHFVQAHQAGVKKVVLDVRRGRLMALSYDRSLSVWQIGGPDLLHETSRTPLPDCVWARAATGLDDGRIAAGTFGTTYALYDPSSGTWDTHGVEAGPAINAAVCADGHVYSVGDAGVVHMDGSPVARTGSLCNFLVVAVGHVFTGGQVGRIFDVPRGAILFEYHSPLNCGTSFVRNDRHCIAIGTYTGEILIFEVEPSGELRLLETLPVYENAVKGLSAADGLLFSDCASTDIAWHRIDDWSTVRRIGRAHSRIANGCCAIGGGRFASVGRDRTLRLWGSDRNEVFQSPHPNSVKCIAVDDERTTVLTGSYGGTLAAFDLRERRWTALHRPTAAGISSIAWDGETRRFLAASYDGSIYPVAP